MATLSLEDGVGKEDAKEDAAEDAKEDVEEDRDAEEDAAEDAEVDAEEDAEEDAKSDRVKNILASLDGLLNESLDEYKSLVEQMRKKIREIERRRPSPEKTVKLFCVCGVWLRLEKFQAGGMCLTCLKMKERMAKAGGGE